MRTEAQGQRDAIGQRWRMHTETSQPSLPEHELVATSTTVVYTNRWMSVRKDKTLRHDGAEGIYGLV
ncbi:hypothetical protein [Streptomyces sp. NPDC001933]|uniref:hypothetical protein n=1 Tax=Streptomyces sp. NPDC001933 TaxID=3364626 RepID=UPI0036D08C54